MIKFNLNFKHCLLLVSLIILNPAESWADETCIYKAENGIIRVASSRSSVPSQFKASMQCQTVSKGDFLAPPEQIDIGSTIRKEELNSPIGKIKLKWPRSAEGLFGRTPVRAMVDSATTVSKVIHSSSFPTDIQKMSLEWNVVFMDENLPESQIPTQLISNCHPGWMTPPANIYIVAQRVAAGCGGEKATASKADKDLTEVLVHEMGHALEYYMLRKNNNHTRMRAEGFATWFEMYAAQFSSLMNKTEITKRTVQMAALAIKSSPNNFEFSGSGLDYARAAMFFSAIEDRFGLRGIISLYDTMNNDGSDLFIATEKKFSLKKDQLNKEVLKFIEKHS